MSKFQSIMYYLDPKLIIEKTEVPHDTARSNCTLQSSTVRDYHEFENLLIAYIAHHMQETLGHYPPPEFCLGKARDMLDNSIGFDNAVYISMSGADGGMNHVLNEICEGFKKEAKQAYFNYIIDRFISPLNFDQITEVMREFKEKLGNYTPESFNYISPEAMGVHYKSILKSYIDSLSRYRNLWNYR